MPCMYVGFPQIFVFLCFGKHGGTYLLNMQLQSTSIVFLSGAGILNCINIKYTLQNNGTTERHCERHRCHITAPGALQSRHCFVAPSSCALSGCDTATIVADDNTGRPSTCCYQREGGGGFVMMRSHRPHWSMCEPSVAEFLCKDPDE